MERMNQKIEYSILDTDLYELTMSNVYFEDGKKDVIAYFDAFFRKSPLDMQYSVMSGGKDIIEFIQNIKIKDSDIEYLREQKIFTEGFLSYLQEFKFTGDVYVIPDGTPVFGNEPLVTVRAPIIEAQIIETMLLTFLNKNILYASAGRKEVEAAGSTGIMEFGARRSADGMCASYNAYMAGCIGSSLTHAGKKYGIPVLGTMAHSFVTAYDNEYEAFLAYAKTFPKNATFLVDTYDTLNSGIPNAIRVAKEYLEPNGYKLNGIRIDSGDLSYLSNMAREMLDQAGLIDTKICVSNGLNAENIMALKKSSPMDSIGSGDHICAPGGRVGCVYKLVAVEKDHNIVSKMKVSDDRGKTIHPGYKKVYRIYDKETGNVIGDLIALAHELLTSDTLIVLESDTPHKKNKLHNITLKNLQELVVQEGSLVMEDRTLEEKRAYCAQEMNTIPEEHKRIINPTKYRVYLTEELQKLKEELLQSVKPKEKIAVKKYENR